MVLFYTLSFIVVVKSLDATHPQENQTTKDPNSLQFNMLILV